MDKARLDWIKKIIHELDWDRLTDWEKNFVESVEDQFRRRGTLSDKQEEILERIYKEKS